VTSVGLSAQFDALQLKLNAAQAGQSFFASDIEACTNFCIDAVDGDRNDLVIALLEPLSKLAPKNARVWQLLGLARRNEQRMEEAAAALATAAALAPDDPKIALAHAQVQFETGRPASRLFRSALRLVPGDFEAIRSAAASLVAEGNPSAAHGLLAKTLQSHPGWLDGHRSLSSMRTVAGEGAAFARSYDEAVKAQPRNLDLRLAWFRAVSLTKDWSLATKVIEEGERDLGAHRLFAFARIYVASESGEAADDPALFDPISDLDDPSVDLCRVRHFLRAGLIERAGVICEQRIKGAAAAEFWPYMSLVWRLTGDARAAWLDGDPLHYAVFDLDITEGDLSELASDLRRLHAMRAPYLDQSVRGGTQTDGQLFFRHDQSVQHVREKIRAAVAAYVAALPPAVDGHPLLGIPRGPLLFEGSWSVRLTSQGFHVCHTHSRGWISSAFYVSRPEPSAMGAPPAGWLAFGTPPPELGLDLPAYAHVEPKPGRLVLFPSTMWHSTVPFDDGERLTIAFDVRRPVA
jgi:tetratricopeptide (TPR) repeat protein